MGTMALGYGSEFHLLRWLGRHRNEFNNKVKDLLEIDNLEWLDFDFDSKKAIPDKEIKGLDFLDEKAQHEAISKFKEEWPQTGNSMNWDLVGFTENNSKKKWILVEAKAHADELKQNCGASSQESLRKIKNALCNAAKNSGIEIKPSKPWTKNHYQLANRLYILDLLKRHNIDAVLLNIYFVGDMCSNSRKSPQEEGGWKQSLDKMKKYLNIKNLISLEIKDLYLEIGK